ncbi:hypothetical protein OA40_18785 [Morganella morganii]|nr:hypothetical protein OA40_18785 [Morganella morganii]KOO20100.1 hypothetical protein AC068_03560 [Morganella morganii]
MIFIAFLPSFCLKKKLSDEKKTINKPARHPQDEFIEKPAVNTRNYHYAFTHHLVTFVIIII